MSEQERTTTDVTKPYDTFRAFMRGEFEPETLRELAEHGADTGWPHLTYYRDTCALYDAYEDELWGLLREYADDGGYDSPLAMIAQLSGDRIEDNTQLQNWIVWFGAEYYAREVADED